MSNHRNSALLSHDEAVRGDLLDCVAACRWRGLNTVAALDKIARHWGIAYRRVRTLMYRDQTIMVPASERAALAERAALLLEKVADEFSEYEMRCRAKAEAIRCREQRQLQLPLGGNVKWHGCGASLRDHAA